MQRPLQKELAHDRILLRNFQIDSGLNPIVNEIAGASVEGIHRGWTILFPCFGPRLPAILPDPGLEMPENLHGADLAGIDAEAANPARPTISVQRRIPQNDLSGERVPREPEPFGGSSQLPVDEDGCPVFARGNGEKNRSRRSKNIIHVDRFARRSALLPLIFRADNDGVFVLTDGE